MSDLAPIVLFTYRRVPKDTIESLLKNGLAMKSELFIYSDGYKSDVDKNDVLEVREYLKSIDGFKSIKIIEASKNKGLANSIIDGSTKVIKKYDKIIVLEDDLTVATDFLNYMNEALDFYKEKKNIWSITGYSPNIKQFNKSKQDIYLSPRGSSWSWATWKDRWDVIDWEIKDYEILKNDIIMQRKFNIGGNDLYKMLELQILGKIDSWAIRWVYNQFKHNMFTVYPIRSKISNNGFIDDKGTHNNTKNNKWEVNIDNTRISIVNVVVNNEKIIEFKKFYDLSFKTRIGYFLKKYGMYDMVKKIYKYIIK